jgi:RNA polymerase sigma-70 factor (ECF subfamily)
MTALPHTERATISVTTDKAPGSARGVKRLEQAKSPDSLQPNFERVFLEQYPRVYGALVRLVGDRAEAEDLALETFWQLHRRPPEAQRTQDLGGWLYRVATNLGLNALRARKRRERYESEAGVAALVQNPADDPEEAAAAQEERERVRQVLAQMDARQAQLLMMRHSGMSYEELGAALGVSPNSIGTLLSRAEREFEKKWRAAGER